MAKYPSVRLYYPGGKAGSFGVVARGILSALRELEVVHHALDYRENPDEDGFLAGGALADIGLYVGDPSHVHVMRGHTRHAEHLILVAPNGLGLPSGAIKSIQRYELTPVSPSSWGAKVVAGAFQKESVEVFRHGVSDAFLWKQGVPRVPPSSARNWSGKWTIVHVTSTASDRKGTITLLRAMSLPRLSDCDLLIKTDPFVAATLRHKVNDLPAEVRSRVHLVDGDFSEESLVPIYTHPSAILVQPSWAEGFGLVPLEAAALGVPVVSTFTSGQRDYQNDIVAVDIDPDPPRNPATIPGEEEEGYPVCEADIERGVVEFKDCHAKLCMGAFVRRPTIAEKWSWTAVVKEFLERRKLPMSEKKLTPYQQEQMFPKTVIASNDVKGDVIVAEVYPDVPRPQLKHVVHAWKNRVIGDRTQVALLVEPFGIYFYAQRYPLAERNGEPALTVGFGQPVGMETDPSELLLGGTRFLFQLVGYSAVEPPYLQAQTEFWLKKVSHSPRTYLPSCPGTMGLAREWLATVLQHDVITRVQPGIGKMENPFFMTEEQRRVRWDRIQREAGILP